MGTTNITQTGTAVGHQGLGTRSPYGIEVWLTAAECVAGKGSALAAADIFQVLEVPAGSLLLGCEAEVMTIDSGTTLTFDIGIAGADEFVDGGDGTTAGYLAVGTNGLISYSDPLRAGSADTLDVVIKTIGSAGDDWVLRLVVTMQDISSKGQPVAAQTLNS